MLSDILTKTAPRYKCKLPNSKEEHFFRPFFVKEEKILLLALEEKSTTALSLAMKVIIENCCQDIEDASKLSFCDACYLFLNIRSKSVGEVIEAKVQDDRLNQYDVFFNLDKDMRVIGEDQNPQIKLNDDVAIEMKEPTLDTYIEISSDDELKSYYEIISKCVKKVKTKDGDIDVSTIDKNELIDFVENLNKSQFQEVVNYITNSKKIILETKYQSESGEKDIKIESIFDFFGFPSVI